MHVFKIPVDTAFGLLVRASQQTDRTLHDIAEEWVATGELPPD